MTDSIWLSHRPPENRLNRLYPALGATAYLLQRLATHDAFPFKLKNLLKDFPTLPLDDMGFPEKWDEEEVWKEVV